MKFLIISKPTLSEILGTIVNPVSWTPIPADEIIEKHTFLVYKQANFTHIASIKDIENDFLNPLIINLTAIEEQPQRLYRAIFSRIDKSAEILRFQSSTLPTNWRPYHAGNKVTFFAVANESQARWITEIQLNPKPHLLYRTLTSTESQIDLNSLESDTQTSTSAFRSIALARNALIEEIKSTHSKFGGLIALGVTLLNDIGSKIVAQNKTFDAWLTALTTVQRNFVEEQKKEPLSIYGPAGSGKTLSLALYSICRCRTETPNLRICFLTQNWSQAYMIDSLVQALSLQSAPNIHVYPLLYVIRSLFQDIKNESSDYRVLIEDSIEGKVQNFEYVREAISDAISHDLPLLRDGMSDVMRKRVDDSRLDKSLLNSLAWDVMNEFASVLSVNRIRPGITAATRYRALGRAAWMMPLANNSDKDLVLAAYSRYIRKLEFSKIISYDQIISDYISKFDTFEWDRRRSSEGYNIVIIDEFHLFTDIERSIIPYLYSDIDTYPRLVMASDPMQSPTDALKGIEFAGRERADASMTKEGGLKFQVFKRYSREIESFVTHVYNSYPTLLQNERLLIDGLSTAVPLKKPELFIHENQVEAINAITRSLEAKEQSAQSTCAVICLNMDDLKDLESHWSHKGISAVFIKDQSDINLMKYSSKRVVASYSEMTAGLQFNEVTILISKWGGLEKGGASLFSNRINLTRLYIAASRATSRLTVHYAADSGDLPAVLQSALDKDLIETGRSEEAAV